MARYYGATTANGRVRMFADVTTATYATYVRVSVTFHVQMMGASSTDGTYPCSWSGYWGNGGQSVYRYITGGNSSQVVTGSYNVNRGASNNTISFYAQCGTYWGTPGQTVTVSIPRKINAPNKGTWATGTNPDQITATSVRLRYTHPGDGGSAITRYEVQRATNSAFTANLQTINPASGSGTQVVSGLTARTLYYFRHRAVNAIGAGPYSNTISAATLGVPDEPSFNPTTVSAGLIVGTLVNPAYVGAGITERQTQLSLTSDFTTIAQTSTTQTTTFSGLTRATEYWVRGRVQNSTGWSDWSTPVKVTTLATLPSAPSNYGVTDIASTTAFTTVPNVSDTGGTTIVGIRAQINTSATDAGATVITETTYRSIFFENLDPGETYYFRLAAQNTGAGGGWGSYGPWVSFTTKTNVPTAPQSLSVTVVTDTTAAASWLAPSSDLGSTRTSYTLRLALNLSFSQGLKIISLAPDVLNRTLDGLLPGTKYYVQIGSVSSNGPGSWSSIVEFTTTGTAPIPQDSWMRLSGVWRPGALHLKVAGSWRQGALWRNINGTWRRFS